MGRFIFRQSQGQIQYRGFTLIELIVTLAVLAIVVAIAAPSFNSMIANSRTSSMTSELTAALNFARSEAIKRVKPVSVCPSSDGASCLTSADWPKGWMVFVDKAATDAADVEVGEMLKHWDKLDKNAAVAFKKGAVAANYVRFNSRGMLARAGASDTDARIFEAYVSGCKGKVGRKITIGVAGLINSSELTCP